jgi:hypothetical protein
MQTDNQQQNETQPYPSYPLGQPPTLPTLKSKKPNWWKRIGIGCGGLVALIILAVVITTIISVAQGDGSHPAPQPTQAPTQAQQQPTQAQPTDTPVPTQSNAQTEQALKALTTNTTVTDLDKNGSSWTDKPVHFTAVIATLVKDSSGNTAGANVSDPANEFGKDIQVGFPANTDISKLNQGDTIEVWGIDGGTQSGANAFGATVQEVVVVASYLNDTTTGYHDNG